MSVNTKKKAIIAGILALTFSAAAFNPLWQDIEGATKAIEAHGLSPIEVGGYAWMACGKSGQWKTEFTASTPSGKEVSGVVCKGFHSGSLVHLYDY